MTPAHIATLTATWLAAMNFVGFVAMAQDKRRAELDLRRTPEAAILNIALLGGWPGVWAAMRLFRHKTRKEPFRSRFSTIAWIEGLAAFGLFLWWIVTG